MPWASLLNLPQISGGQTLLTRQAVSTSLQRRGCCHCRTCSMPGPKLFMRGGVLMLLRATRRLLLRGEQRLLWQNSPGGMQMGRGLYAAPGQVRQELVLRALPAARYTLPALHRSAIPLNAVLQSFPTPSRVSKPIEISSADSACPSRTCPLDCQAATKGGSTAAACLSVQRTSCAAALTP